MADGAPAKTGHNQGPPLFDQSAADPFRETLNKHAEAAGLWLDKNKIPKIETEDQAQKLNDAIAGWQSFRKEVEAARIAAKKPFDEAGKDVQKAFTPIVQSIDVAVQTMKGLLKPYLDAKAARERQEAEEKRLQAEAEAAKAAQAAAQAEARGDVVGMAAAAADAKQADKDAKRAAKPVKATGAIASATGGGRKRALRTVQRARIDGRKQAFLHMERLMPDEVDRVLTDWALKLKRSGAATEIPGVVFYEEQVL